MKTKKKGGFSGQLGFVMAAAGSAVGVGNIWRFPYLTAKDGGGLFLLVYLALVLTFGFTLLTSDLAIGRKTKMSSIYAYGQVKSGWKFLGYITFVVPALIMTYYAIIGGWITKYILIYLTNSSKDAVKDNYFTDFITSKVSPIVLMLIFMTITSIIVFLGVEKGIEKFSKIIMPGLFVIIVGIAIYSLTLSHNVTLPSGKQITRTGLDGLKVYVIPDFSGLTVKKFLQVLLDAMSQLFFSLSVSMGIMITYGSYVKDDIDLNKAVSQIEIFDTAAAFLAGLMIIPSIFVFSGVEGMSAGPGLIFISLPKVFNEMGIAGKVVGLVFFVMVFFAALSSCISVLETLVANCMELFKVSRKKVTVILTLIYMLASIVVCLGYNVFYFEVKLPNGSTGQLLDIMDYISNSFLMPLISLISAILIGWVVGPDWIIGEVCKNGEKFRRKLIYRIMIKYIAPVIMFVLFLQSIGVF
ncbi:sodium-dependent transporter [Lachnobacterium bovis]|jgi:NSS family neurotransmitter:Na+ symporter|uniref:Neurotransmitter:Na+ symporter, NSS family n=1 Tax=Lachnobacterium bovis DSM 14045 TaxID=1122142 RepID=A0A1H3H8P9_9FIRM|nr:sodium-dependent transporter [Lachnobacterium bovis]SDY11882.1 neurotransmitter:Na+ symporter, NSS family [Lachnobacterium bovis DSM 14045]